MLDEMLKQAMSMNSELGNLKELCDKIEVSGESAAGSVKVRVNGNYECIGVDIDEGLLRAESKAIVEDLIRAAMNNANRKLTKEREQVVQQFAFKHLASLNPLGMKNPT